MKNTILIKRRVTNWIKHQLRKVGILPSTSERIPKGIDKEVRTCIRVYYEGWEPNDEVAAINKHGLKSLEITNIKVNNKKLKIIITITLTRPGILIGKGGSEIDNLTQYISEYMDKPVIINIIESRLWG